MPTLHTAANHGTARGAVTATLLCALAITGCTPRPVAGTPRTTATHHHDSHTRHHTDTITRQ